MSDVLNNSAMCSWEHGIVTKSDLWNHQVCGACAGDEPFYIVRDGVTEDTVKCKYCIHKFREHGLRRRFWVDQEMDWIARLECKIDDCACNRFQVHEGDKDK